MEEQTKPVEVPAAGVASEQKGCCDSNKMMMKVVIGVVLIGLGLWAVIGWWGSLLMVIKGCIGLFLALAGLIFIAIAKE
ncbi:MAG: hypothetical protein ABH865_01475 [Candidatus Omnitrophota bacterium]